MAGNVVSLRLRNALEAVSATPRGPRHSEPRCRPPAAAPRSRFRKARAPLVVTQTQCRSANAADTRSASDVAAVNGDHNAQRSKRSDPCLSQLSVHWILRPCAQCAQCQGRRPRDQRLGGRRAPPMGGQWHGRHHELTGGTQTTMCSCPARRTCRSGTRRFCTRSAALSTLH